MVLKLIFKREQQLQIFSKSRKVKKKVNNKLKNKTL